MKKTIYIVLLLIGGLSIALTGFSIGDEILKMLNERDTFLNIGGVACLMLWWLVIGMCEYAMFQIIYKIYKIK
jgi:hypothetical protein